MSIFVRKTELSGLIAAALKGQDASILEGLGDSEIRLKNTESAAQPVYSVFHLGNSVLTPTTNESSYKFGQPAIEGEEVSEDDDEAIAVVQKPANVNKLVPARAAGITRVRLVGDADKTHATTREGEYTLEAADSGPCLILYDPGPGGEERIAWVRIGSGGGSCSEVDCLNLFGPVTGGSVTLSYTIERKDGTLGTDTVVLNYNASAMDAKTAFEGHDYIEADEVQVAGGPWPNVALHVIFGGEIKTPVALPTVSTSLTGTGVTFRMWKASSSNWKGYV